MKIVSAVCEPAVGHTQAGMLRATVIVCDEGQRYIGTSCSERPEEAIHAALCEATRAVSDKLHDSLAVKHEVTF